MEILSALFFFVNVNFALFLKSHSSHKLVCQRRTRTNPINRLLNLYFESPFISNAAKMSDAEEDHEVGA